MKKIDLTNKRFGRLIALSSQSKVVGLTKPQRKIFWLCRCDCGTIKYIPIKCLLGKEAFSCGCLKREKIIERNMRHGMSKTRFYHTWLDMNSRCYRKNNKFYNNYGGRGIRVLWKNFDDFKKDMYRTYQNHFQKFGRMNTTIDRINNDSHYSKENCKWSTRKEQERNKTNNRIIIYNNLSMTLADWAEHLGMSRKTLSSRINTYKWSIERAINQRVRLSRVI